MALVPADKALDVAQAIKTKYETEMGKVRNRLPLTLGLVFAQARTPLAAVLDAGRRMLKRKPQEQDFTIEDAQTVGKDRQCRRSFLFHFLSLKSAMFGTIPTVRAAGQKMSFDCLEN